MKGTTAIRHSLLFFSILLGVAACVGIGSGATDNVVGRNQVVVPMSQIPAYALHRAVDYSSGFLMAEANYNLLAVQCYRPYSTVLPGQTPPTVNLTPSFATCQGIAVGMSSFGQAFVIVILTDFQSSQSILEMWQDTNGDFLPEQITRTTLTTLVGVELTDCVYDKNTGTLYATDGLSDSVLRFADTNGDLIPNPTWTTFVQGAGVRYLANPTGNQVQVYHKQQGRWIGHPFLYLLCVDQDGDGLAETITEKGPRHELGDGVDD